MAHFCNLGLRGYQVTWDMQVELADRVKSGSLSPGVLLFVEHPPVLTLGANFHEENLRLPISEYDAQHGIEVIRTDRGGDVTFHGPGQLVIYPVFNVAELVGKDLHLWLRQLEETMLRVMTSFGLQGRRFPPHTGAWIGDRKVAAIGIKVSRWVSVHGIALNCDNDLSAFELIVPCGIRDYGVTSLTQELGMRVTMKDAAERTVRAFQDVFNIQLEALSVSELRDLGR